jgi:hypothetical protein
MVQLVLADVEATVNALPSSLAPFFRDALARSISGPSFFLKGIYKIRRLPPKQKIPGSSLGG